MRCTIALAVVWAVLVSPVAMAAGDFVPFTDASQINILERWNPNGSYYYSQVKHPNLRVLSDAVCYRAAVAGMYTANLSGVTGTPEGTIIFNEPMPVDRLMLQWRDLNHTPTEWWIYDLNDNLIATGTRDRVDSEGAALPWLATRNYTVADGTLLTKGASITGLKIVTTKTSGNNCMDLSRIGAYLAPGSRVEMDGSFNIFREEVPKNAASVAETGNKTMTVETSRVDSTKTALTQAQLGFITDDKLDGNRPGLGFAGEIIWEFSQEYTFTGAFLSRLEDNNNAIVGVSIAVFDETIGTDGDWVTVFYPKNITATGYLVFLDPTDPEGKRLLEVTGKKVRLSWADSLSGSDNNPGGGREINEFQLFGYIPVIPEPATMTLLALGGLALLRRRRAA